MFVYWFTTCILIQLTSAQYDGPLPPTGAGHPGKSPYFSKGPISRGKGAPAHEPMTYAAQNGYSLETDEDGSYRIGDKAVDGYESLYIEETTVSSPASTTTVAPVKRRLGRSSESEEENDNGQEQNELSKPSDTDEGSGLDQYASLYLEEPKTKDEHAAAFNTRSTTESPVTVSPTRHVVMKSSVMKKEAVNMVIYNELRKPMKEQLSGRGYYGDSSASIGIRISTSTEKTTEATPIVITKPTTKKPYVVISLIHQHNRRRVLDSQARSLLHAGESRLAVHKNHGIWKHAKTTEKKKIVTRRIVMDRSSAKWLRHLQKNRNSGRTDGRTHRGKRN